MDEAKNKVVSSFHEGEDKKHSPLFWIGLIWIIIVLVLFFLYSWVPSHPNNSTWNPVRIDVEDGMNADDTYGCFFLLRAGRGVDIDPNEYSFFVAEKGFPPKKLDFELRTYDGDGNPTGGDRTAPGCPTHENFNESSWSEGEYIGFDMPTRNMGIKIVDGNVYEVMIKDPRGNVIFRDFFVYTCQG